MQEKELIITANEPPTPTNVKTAVCSRYFHPRREFSTTHAANLYCLRKSTNASAR